MAEAMHKSNGSVTNAAIDSINRKNTHAPATFRATIKSGAPLILLNGEIYNADTLTIASQRIMYTFAVLKESGAVLTKYGQGARNGVLSYQHTLSTLKTERGREA